MRARCDLRSFQPLEFDMKSKAVISATRDWRSHRLSAAPRGDHWVQTGNGDVLVAIAAGVILQLLLNN